jgi:hypothetical protein
MVERLSLPGFLNYWEPAVAKCLKERIKITSAASTGGKDIRRKTFYSHLLSAEKFFLKKKNDRTNYFDLLRFYTRE